MKNTQELAETIHAQLYPEVDDREYPRRVFIERDNETGEKRWFSIKGMGIEYVRADRAANLSQNLQNALEAVIYTYGMNNGDRPEIFKAEMEKAVSMAKDAAMSWKAND